MDKSNKELYTIWLESSFQNILNDVISHEWDMLDLWKCFEYTKNCKP